MANFIVPEKKKFYVHTINFPAQRVENLTNISKFRSFSKTSLTLC